MKLSWIASQLPQLEEGDYYWKDLMGCQVVTTEGYDLGKVVDMMETGSNDVLVIKANLKDAFGIKERLVPFLDGQVIKKVNLTTRSIEVDSNPGTLNHRINGKRRRYVDQRGFFACFLKMFRAITDYGVTGRAVKNGLLSIQSWSPRDFTHDRHRTVDDHPYGGGPGMLMMVQPLRDAIHAAKAAAGEGAKVIYLSPQGRKLDRAGVSELATNQKLILVCGRYEGIDERVIQTEISKDG